MVDSTNVSPMPPKRSTEVNKEDVKEAVSNEKRIPLTKPIEVETESGRKTIKELVLRYPTFEDVMGRPPPYRTYASSGRMEIVADWTATRDWIEHLTDYSRNEIGSLSSRDGMAVYNWICEETSAPAGN